MTFDPPLDYKNFEEGKYPEPENRKTAKDFPGLDELFVYGVDVPVPSSMDELRCRYNPDPRVPLVLADLEGYKVPPLGMASVAKHGSGHRQGILYPPGTFRENRHTFNKELGVNPVEANIIRKDSQIEAIKSGLLKAYKENNIKISGNSTAEVLGTFTYVVADKLLKDEAPVKELRLLWEKTVSLLSASEESADKLREVYTTQLGIKSLDAANNMIEALNNIIAEKKQNRK